MASPTATTHCSTPTVDLATFVGAVDEQTGARPVAGAHVEAKAFSRSTVRAHAGVTSAQPQVGGTEAVPFTVAPVATPLTSPIEPVHPLPPIPLPAPATMTGGTCGVAGSDRADQQRGGDFWNAITPGQPTPDDSALMLQPTLTARAHPVSGADEPAVQPD